MKKITLPLLLGLIACVACIYFFAGFATDPRPVTDPGASSSDASSGNPGEVGSVDRRRHKTSSKDRDPTRDDPERQPQGMRSITVTGRCLDKDTDLPIAGCEVELLARPRTARRTTRSEDDIRASTRSSRDGRFSIAIRCSTHNRLDIQTRSPGYADMEGKIEGDGATHAVGDIKMPAGTFLVGIVEDQAGNPQPNVSLRFFRNTASRQTGVHPTTWFKMTSDITGALASDVRLACQAWRLGSAEDGVKILKPAANFEVTAGQETQHLNVVVKMPDPKAMIRGRVVDTDDAPIGRVIIQALDGGKWPVGFGYSRPDGTFTVQCRKDPANPVHLEVPHAKGFEKLRTQMPVAWGTDGVELVMERAGDLRVVVVEAGQERPVEHYQVFWYQAYKPGERAPQTGRQPAAHHPGGETVIEGVPQGAAQLVVVPSEERLAPNDPIDFIKSNQSPQLRVTLEARLSLKVRVTNGAGRAVPGTTLELLQPEPGSEVSVSTPSVGSDNFLRIYRTNSKVLKLDEVQTDELGVGVLRWRASSKRLAVRALGPGHVPVVQSEVTLSRDGQSMELQVETGATLLGQLQPVDVVRQLSSGGNGADPDGQAATRWRGLGPKITLEFAERDRSIQPESVVVEPDGSFELEGLTPGTWRVRFSAMQFVNGRSYSTGDKVLGRAILGNGTTQRVVYDISDLRPASLVGRVFLNGEVATQTNIQLIRIAEQGANRRAGTSLMLRTDDNGTFSTKAIRPGRYAIAAEAAGAGARRPRLTSSTVTSILPGSDTSQDFYIDAGTLRARILHPDGSLASNRAFQVTNQASKQILQAKSDADGVLTMAQVSTGAYVIKALVKPAPDGDAPPNSFGVTRQGKYATVGTVTVTAGSDAATVTLTMPRR